MAKLATTFNASDFDTEQRDYEELPNGIYALEIEASDVVPTKAGTGTILKVTNTVLEPDAYAGRKLFATYNLENANPQAAEIGQRQFASLCRAIGITEVEDSEQLHFHRYVVKVKLGKPSKDGQYPARAEIGTYYFPDQGNVPEPAIDEQQPVVAANDNRRPAANDNRPAPAAAAAGGARRPWGSK